MRRLIVIPVLLLAACASTSTPKNDYDIVLRNATLYDGSGKPAAQGDLAIRGDRIAAAGEVHGRGANEIDVHGLAVAPGFINIMSQAQESLIAGACGGGAGQKNCDQQTARANLKERRSDSQICPVGL